MGKECLLKELENKSDIEHGPRTQGVRARAKGRVQAYQKGTDTQEGRDLGTTAETEHSY